MGDYSGIYISGKEIFTHRNDPHPHHEDVFTVDDAVYLVGEEALPYSSAWHAGTLACDVNDVEVYALSATVAEIKDRLSALGFGLDVLRSSVQRLIDEEISHSYRMLSHFEQMGNVGEVTGELNEKIAELRQLTYESWQLQVAEHVERKRRASPDWRDCGPLGLLRGDDPRILLRVLVEHFGDDEEVLLDLSDYIDGGRAADDPEEWPPSWRLDDIPPIVITEGSFDVTVLRNAIEILRPHLVPYIRFLDYSVGNEGGAAAAVRTLKSFAAAGIAHRIVAIFDNDSAAYEAVMNLRPNSLPAHYTVMHYPDLPLAERYPTLGPQGDALMNVNRLAGSIELYLGRDVLELSNGKLTPVQWKGYMNKVGAYQGEVMNKGSLQSAFRAKVDEAASNPEKIKEQDWSGLELILDSLLEELSALGGPVRTYNRPISLSDFVEG